MNRDQIENIVNQRLADLKREIKEELSAEFAGLRSTRKNSSGHKKAGESWERSPKGSKWKAELEAAKEELKRIIGERTGQDAYGNQQLVTKYASAKRKGNTEEMGKIVEEVVANARGGEGMVATVPTPSITRRNKNNRNNKVININANRNINRLMNSTFVALPQKPQTPSTIPPVALAPQKPVEELNEFNLTEPFTYGDDSNGPY
jgi:hypothetical protein